MNRRTILLVTLALIAALIHPGTARAEDDIFRLLTRPGGIVFVEDVEALVNRNPSLVGARDAYGCTPLHYAHHAGLAEFLLAKGADINATAKSGDTPLTLMLKWGYGSVAMLLIEKGADTNIRLKDGTTTLHRAAEKGYLDIATLLLQKGAGANTANDAGTTPLFGAVASGNLALVELLVARGADVNAATKAGGTPLMLVFDKRKRGADSVKLLKYLIAKGAKFNDLRTPEGKSLLHEAVEAVYEDAAYGEAYFLATHGADVNAVDRSKRVPLVYAAKYGHEKVVSLLLYYGARVDAKAEFQETPLHFAASNWTENVSQQERQKIYQSKLTIAGMLLAKGANPNAQQWNGDTPLHIAASCGFAEMIELLLSKGANPAIKNKEGKTPLDELHTHVQGPGVKKIEELFRKYGGR